MIHTAQILAIAWQTRLVILLRLASLASLLFPPNTRRTTLCHLTHMAQSPKTNKESIKQITLSSLAIANLRQRRTMYLLCPSITRYNQQQASFALPRQMATRWCKPPQHNHGSTMASKVNRQRKNRG